MDTKETQVQIKATHAEKRDWLAQAERERMSLSVWLRHLANTRVTERSEASRG